MKNNIYACLEIGCAEARIIVCNIREERLYVLSQQTIETEGIENGNISNVNQVVQKLKTLKERVESDLNQEIQQVLLSIPTFDVSIENVKTTLELEANQPINSANIKQLLRNIINQPAKQEQVVVSILPRMFKIDSQNAIQNPQGLLGKQLTLDSQKVLAPAMLVYNFINVAELAGFRISDIILGSAVEALFLQNSQQLGNGICHVNIGKSTTTITVLHSGKIDSTKALTIGGQSVTMDICESFSINEEVAEMLKLNFGRVNSNLNPQEIIYVNEVEGELICITRQMLGDVIALSYERIFKAVKQHLKEYSYKSGEIQYVLTGGASEIEGLEDQGRKCLSHDLMIYRPSMLGVRHAKFAKIVGMAIFSHEISLLTEPKSNIINLSQYENLDGNININNTEKSSDNSSEKVTTQEKSFMDHKLESSGVLVRLFDMIFDEKAK